MNDLVELWEKPVAQEQYMIAGWHQWADAGSISSGLPQYLIDQTRATKVGQIKSKEFYLFQIPGTHHFLRPEVKLEDGYQAGLSSRSNQFFHTGDDEKGLVIFLGEEPHLHVERYAEAFFDAVEELGVKRVAVVGGVYGSMPYDKDRDVSCAYSLPEMKDELTKYAVRFSNYEGGATIGSYMLGDAKKRGLEYFVFYAFVPAYDFSQSNPNIQGIRIENDYKAWYDLMRRFDHMFALGFDFADLESQSEELSSTLDAKFKEIEQKVPQLKVREYLDQLAEGFTERPFMPLGDFWERELGDLLDDLDD